MKIRALCLVLVMMTMACTEVEHRPSGDGGQTVGEPAPDADAMVKVLLYFDMEGLSGQDDWRSYFFSFPEQYEQGRTRLMLDLNATIDGLFAGGADSVHVYDGHGSGNPEPDAVVEVLDPRARMVEPEEGDGVWVTDLAQRGAYDAVAGIGLHSKTGAGGFASHTLTGGMEVILNGRSVTEAEISAFAWGEVGTPWVFAAGDDKLRDNLKETMPWVEVVITKRAIDAKTAELRPEDEVLAELRDRAKYALENRHRAKAPRLVPPIRAGLRAVPPASLGLLTSAPGIEVENGAVFFTAGDLRSAYRGLFPWVEVARALGYFELLSRRAEGDTTWARVKAELRSDWLAIWGEQESGRWPPN